MSEVKREHLAGLKLALSSGVIASPDMQQIVRKMIAQAGATPEQDPVAWVIDWPEEPELGHYFSDESNPTARSRPLYTHSDPSEVVRLAELVATGNDLLNVATQRADAAERKLGEALAIIERVKVKELVSPNCPLGKRIDALLPASAEPASPESIDLYRFLDAAAGDGLICGDVDAGDLFVSLYPAAYAGITTEPAKGGDGEAA